MIRIAHIIHGSPPESMGGTGLYVDALATAQAEAGHPTAILSPHPGKPTTQRAERNHVEHWAIETDGLRQWTDTWKGSTDAWSVWCAHWKPDIIHVHHLSGWPLRLIETAPCRTILTLHDYAIPCARGQLIREDLTLCDGPSPQACTACLGPALRTHPALTTVARLLQPFPAVTTLGRSLLRRGNPLSDPRVAARSTAAATAINAADIVLSPSDDLIERMATMGYRRPIRTALPLLRPPAPIQPPADGPVRFLFASSIIPTKGPDRLVNAFINMDQDATLTIAGHAPPFDGYPTFAADLERAIRDHPKVQWIGAIPPEDIPELMAKHDVLVLPSIWPENSPLVVREATAAGLHIIASAIGGTRELAPNGTIFQNEEELQRAIEEAIQVGRIRHPSTLWPTPAEHARTLLTGPYAQVQA
jgi:glycosyltransferase involved in cell wall biosynthesis